MKKTRRKKGPEDQEDEQNHKDKENQQDQESKYIWSQILFACNLHQLTIIFGQLQAEQAVLDFGYGKWIDNRGPRGPVFLHPPRQTKFAKLLERSQVYHLFHIQILCQACSKELQTVS